MGSGAIPNRQGVALAGNRLPGQVRLLLFGIRFLQFLYKLSGGFCVGKNLCPTVLVIIVVPCFFIENSKSATIRDIGIRAAGFYHRVAMIRFYILLNGGRISLSRVKARTDEVIKVKCDKFLENQFREILVLISMYQFAVQQVTDGRLYEICFHLKDVLFVVRGGTGQPDMPQVGKIHLGTIFILTKFCNQPFGCIKLGLFVGFREHFLCACSRRQVFFLLAFHPFPHDGYRLIPEDGKSSSDPKGIIPQADTPRSVIDLINSIDTVFLLQLHPQGNKISHIQVFDNLILTVLPFANSDVMAVKL